MSIIQYGCPLNWSHYGSNELCSEHSSPFPKGSIHVIELLDSVVALRSPTHSLKIWQSWALRDPLLIPPMPCLLTLPRNALPCLPQVPTYSSAASGPGDRWAAENLCWTATSPELAGASLTPVLRSTRALWYICSTQHWWCTGSRTLGLGCE